MTRYFEVEQRDGAARVGKLLLSPTIRTPCILHTADLGKFEDAERTERTFPIVDAGSLWTEAPETLEAKLRQIRTKAGEKTLIIHPHQAYPPAVQEDSRGKIRLPEMELNGAVGAVLRSGAEEIPKSDLFIMEGAGSLENNARKFLEDLLDLKARIPPDTALYTPKLALPENAGVLVYLGVDILDDTRAELAAYSDIYLTAAGSFYLDTLQEFPCRCSACAPTTPEEVKALPKHERAELLAAHNRNALEAELALVREKIRAGNLREYVEGQCRVRPWLTALLRLADFEQTYLEEKTTTYRKNTLIANTSESLTRVEVNRFARRVQERYTPPELDILLLLPCAAKKPYSISQSHQKFLHALGKYKKYIHEVIITSPLGIVPRELELTYPAAHYDVAVTGHWDEEEKNWVSSCLESYLEKHSYGAIVAHLEGAYREVCERAAEKLGIEVIYTSTGSPTSRESLSTLKTAVETLCTSEGQNWKTRNVEKAKYDFVKGILAYQFGEVSELLFEEKASEVPENVENAERPENTEKQQKTENRNIAIKGRFPKYHLYSKKTQLATLVPQYGTLALSMEGAEMMVSGGKYLVEIDDFLPKGSILAPGVIAADPEIRPNDEVIVIGKKALCVGRALMSGQEMEKATRGAAVSLRHVKKL